jgi:hypothetical protein
MKSEKIKEEVEKVWKELKNEQTTNSKVENPLLKSLKKQKELDSKGKGR